MNHPAANTDPARLGILYVDGDVDADVGGEVGGGARVRFTRHLNHSVEDVWRCITEAAQRRSWFHELELEPEVRVGGRVVVNFSGGDCPAPEDNPEDVYYCEVIGYEPLRLLEYRTPDGALPESALSKDSLLKDSLPEDSLLKDSLPKDSLPEERTPAEHHRFELRPAGKGCILTFVANLPDADQFDDDAGTIQSRYSVACGWHYKLDAMEWVLDGTAFEDEGYAGPVKVSLYLAYLEREKENNR